MRNKLLILMSLVLLAVSCHKVPITGRRQVKLLPNSTLNSMSFSNYKQFLSENPVASNTKDAQMVKRVGLRIQKATENYFSKIGKKDKYLKGFAWEFNLVNDPAVNAWCMPGGKVVVYSGLLPVAKTEDGLAVVMGHEIAHAIANHGNERMSQGLSAQLGGMALDAALSSKPEQTRSLFLNAYGVGSQVAVLLPFSRTHESEADEIGLYLMAMAGYNPEEAVPFWQRMSATGGAKPPELLSTHPSDATRIKNLKAKIPVAKNLAAKYGI